MILNSSKSITLILLCALFGLNLCLSQYPSGLIKEENYMGRIYKKSLFKNEPGNSLNNNNNKKIKKEYSNKEVVFGQDDDDDDESAEDDQDTTPVLPTRNTFNRLSRNQRIDYINNNNNNNNHNNKLKSFHNNKNLQDFYLNKQENDFNFDYNLMLQELLKNSELFEDEMKLKDISSSIGKNKFNDFEQEDMIKSSASAAAAASSSSSSSSSRNNNKNLKPVKYVDVKEKLFLENDYNKQFINDPKYQINQDPYFSQLEPQDLFKNMNLNLNQDSKEQEKQLNEKQNPSNSIDSPPSMVNKHQNSIDPNINAKIDQIKKQNDHLFIFVVAGCTLAGVVALIAAGVCWYTVYRHSKKTDDEFCLKNNNKFNSGASVKSNTSSGDRRLAQSAQMYHYQHQKQQMIAMEKANNDTKPDNSDNSEGETEEGDYTVYECPGLAPTGEMEVKNPLFKEELSSSSSNIFLSTQPPAYSTISSKIENEEKKEELIKLEENKPTESISIQINEIESKPIQN